MTNTTTTTVNVDDAPQPVFSYPLGAARDYHRLLCETRDVLWEQHHNTDTVTSVDIELLINKINYAMTSWTTLPNGGHVTSRYVNTITTCNQ